MGRTALLFVVAIAAVLNSVQSSPLDLEAILKEHDDHNKNVAIEPKMENEDSTLTVVGKFPNFQQLNASKNIPRILTASLHLIILARNRCQIWLPRRSSQDHH